MKKSCLRSNLSRGVFSAITCRHRQEPHPARSVFPLGMKYAFLVEPPVGVGAEEIPLGLQ